MKNMFLKKSRHKMDILIYVSNFHSKTYIDYSYKKRRRVKCMYEYRILSCCGIKSKRMYNKNMT